MAGVSLSMIDADNSDTDGIAAPSLELRYLVAQVANHAVNLFDHCFCENFNFCSYFDRRNGTSRYGKSRLNSWSDAGDNFAERAVPSTGLNPAKSILNIHNTLLTRDSIRQLGRAINCDEIFIQVNCDDVALV